MGIFSNAAKIQLYGIKGLEKNKKGLTKVNPFLTSIGN
jgi:hypothetical protein